MNFIDFVILIIVLGTLGLIAYFNFIKKDKDACSRCAYKRQNCDCGMRNYLSKDRFAIKRAKVLAYRIKKEIDKKR